jgi:hypothetical protein
MTPDEARAVLGVGRAVSPDELRAAYRRLVRSHHPDLAGAESTATAARVNEAYAVLTRPAPARPRAARRAPSPPPPPRRTPPPPPDLSPGGDTFPLSSPTLAVFEQLCEAADVLGDVSYVDASCGILETIVSWPGWPPCSLMITVQVRGRDTLAQCTLEPLTPQPGPPIEQVVRELHRIMAALAE